MPVFGQKPDTGHSPALRRGSLWHISFASFFRPGKERGLPEATGQGKRMAEASGESAERPEDYLLRRKRYEGRKTRVWTKAFRAAARPHFF